MIPHDNEFLRMMYKNAKTRFKNQFTMDYKKQISSPKPNEISFYSQLKKKHSDNFFHLIAEVKRKSPSKGDIQPNISIDFLIKIYNQFASAISVLTESDYFGGSLNDLSQVQSLTNLPILRKDFLIDPSQIEEARYFGASAVLIIAAFLDKNQIQEMLDAVKLWKMDALVEIHNLEDWEKISDMNISVLGINNRNLNDLSIDLKQTNYILKNIENQIDQNIAMVSESGIKSQEDIRKISSSIDALLIGSSLMESDSLFEKLNSLGFSSKKNQ